MTRSDRTPGRQILVRLGFVVILVAGTMGFTVGAKASGPAHIRVFGAGLAIPPGPGLAVASMMLAASVLAAVVTASLLVAERSRSVPNEE